MQQTIMLLTPLVLATGLFAQGSTTSVEWEKFSALGIVAVVLIFLVTRMMPVALAEIVKQSAEFRAAILSNQIAFTESLSKIMDNHEADQKLIVAELAKMREQCLATQIKIAGEK